VLSSNSMPNDFPTLSDRTDLRIHDGHESWRGTYRLCDVDPSVEPRDEVIRRA